MNNEIRQQIATEILRQLGGNRAIAMTGAKNMMFGMNGELIFQLPNNFAKNKINRVKISLNANDLYDIDYGYARGLNYKVIAKSENVYAEDLRRDFEAETGLFLKL